MSKQRPILFSTSMVQAILSGKKTQTRRICKYPISENQTHGWDITETGAEYSVNGKSARSICPYGKPGDVLWVRESFLYRANKSAVIYKADLEKFEAVGVGAMYGGWKPSIHMPKEAARIWLKITSIKVDRLINISISDAKAEGITWEQGEEWECEPGRIENAYLEKFKSLWQSINGEQSWNTNPWVWVVEFERIDKPETTYTNV